MVLHTQKFGARQHIRLGLGMKHNMSWGAVLRDWAGKKHEIHFVDKEGDEQPVDSCWTSYGLKDFENTEEIVLIKNFIRLINSEILWNLPSQKEQIPKEDINRLLTLLQDTLSYTADEIATLEHSTLIKQAQELSHKVSEQDMALIEDSQLLEMTRISMLFDDSDPVQEHLIALNHIRQSMHQGALLYTMQATIKQRVHDNFSHKKKLRAPGCSGGTYMTQRVVMKVVGGNLDVTVSSEFRGSLCVFQDDEPVTVIQEAEKAHLLANTHCLVSLSGIKTRYDFKKSEIDCQHPLLLAVVSPKALREQNYLLREDLNRLLTKHKNANGETRRLDEKIKLLDMVSSVISGEEKFTDELSTQIDAMLERPNEPELRFHLQHFKAQHAAENFVKVTEIVATINAERIRVEKALSLLVEKCRDAMGTYQHTLDAPDTFVSPSGFSSGVYAPQGQDKQLHQHKRNVLKAAIKFANHEISADEFLDIRVANPRWAEATFSSTAEKLVNRIIDLTSGRDELMREIDIAIEKNRVKSERQPQATKYRHKLAVLQAAKETLLDGATDQKPLNEAIAKNPGWNSRSLTMSTTEKLVREVQERVAAVKAMQHETPRPIPGFPSSG